MLACFSQQAFAATTVWQKAEEIMKDVYNQILLISTIAAVVTASIALLMMNFSKSGKTVDEARAWLKRIVITWAILNGLGLHCQLHHALLRRRPVVVPVSANNPGNSERRVMPVGILDGIVAWIAEQVMHGLDLISTSVLGALGCDMGTFLRYFPAPRRCITFLWRLQSPDSLKLGVAAFPELRPCRRA